MDINNIESKRLVLPPRIAAIVEDARVHPEKGNVLSRISAHGQRLWDKAREDAANEKRLRSNGEPGHASVITQNKFQCIDKLETPQIQGSLSIISNDGPPNNVVCSGYLVSSASNEPNHVMIVLEVDGKMTPCICPKNLIDFPIPATVQYIVDRRGGQQEWFVNNIVVESKPAQRMDGELGHLIMDGQLKGRVVDSTMLESLRSGCLRIKGRQSFYTLDRRYVIDANVLKKTARIVIASKSDGLMKLCPATRQDIPIIISIANVVLSSKSAYHKTLILAIEHLQFAGSLPPVSLSEELFQISIGGNSSPDAMTIGKFLSCAGLLECPNIRVRCACGFSVDGMAKGKDLLKKRCNNKHCKDK